MTQPHGSVNHPFMRSLTSLAVALLLMQPAAAYAQRVSTPGASPFVPAAEAPSPMAGPLAAPTLSAPDDISEGIIAVVNDGVITSTDLSERISLAILSSGLPASADLKKRLLPQVLHALIDEQLQMQEGKRMDIAVTETEVMDALKRIAQDNNIEGGDMIAYVNQKGVSPSAIKAQVKAGLTWNKVIGRAIRPRIDVGDDEVDAAIARIQANAGKPEYLVSEIFLAVDNPRDEAQVQSFADNLVQQIKGGAVFGAIARQFSQGTGAAAGGDIGWIQSGQLGADIDKHLRQMNAGDISAPIRTANGFHIIGVRDRRTVAAAETKDLTVKLEQFFRPFAPGEDKETVLAEAEALRASINGCQALADKAATSFPAWRWQDLGEIKIDAAPAWLAEKVRDLSEGQPSEALATDKGSLIVVVCKRTIPLDIDRKTITNTIGGDKMDLAARRLLRDLRRSAYIDVRL